MVMVANSFGPSPTTHTNKSHSCMQTLLPRSSSAEWVAAPTKAIKLIDYEYSGMNAVAFDIANHW